MMNEMMNDKESRKLAILIIVFAMLVIVVGVATLILCSPKSSSVPEEVEEALAPIATESVAEEVEEALAPEIIEPVFEEAEEFMAPVATESVVKETEESMAPVATESVAEVEEDPYAIFVTDENWVKETNGYAIERKGKLYTLSALMPSTVISEYNCGYQTGGKFEEGRGSDLYLYDQREISDVPTKATDAIISIGDFPIYYVDSGEELRVYSDEPLEEVEIKQAEFYGYTIPATGRQVTYFPIQDYIYEGLDGNITDPAVLTTDGNPVEDVRKLNYGEQYMFEWYEGVDYHSQTLPATSRCYIVDDDNLAIKVPVKKTKNGYGIVDLSEVEPGNYYTISNVLGVFELR